MRDERTKEAAGAVLSTRKVLMEVDEERTTGNVAIAGGGIEAQERQRVYCNVRKGKVCGSAGKCNVVVPALVGSVFWRLCLASAEVGRLFYSRGRNAGEKSRDQGKCEAWLGHPQYRNTESYVCGLLLRCAARGTREGRREGGTDPTCSMWKDERQTGQPPLVAELSSPVQQRSLLPCLLLPARSSCLCSRSQKSPHFGSPSFFCTTRRQLLDKATVKGKFQGLNCPTKAPGGPNGKERRLLSETLARKEQLAEHQAETLCRP